ncbi:hypothetical protein GFY24_37645 [Nocardia sp. SYP-A9097]|uniref:hypothetical protein n=1 Tax=Nocardia sp. SYP-A9097 TaxID=2663237 RepID=UPI00129ADBE9|nr:hypothetical protein [Nocardia sp. SYP-A9097]MRH93082.1 hypothetical protein [Nocardia sp. SYP-A9097]
MKLGQHPQRTPFYGVLMLLTFMISGLFVRDLPWLALRIAAWIALLAIAIVGFLMTFRDYS